MIVSITSHIKPISATCMADGTKQKPMVIFKRKDIPKGEKKPPGVLVHCHPKGWMDNEEIVLWLNICFVD